MIDPHRQEAATASGVDSPEPDGAFLATAKAGALLVLLLLAFFGLRYTEAGAHFSREGIQALINGFGLLAPVAHVLLYALGTTALIPATVFTLIGAVVFGKLLGSIYNLVGATGGAVLSFLTARYLGRDFAARWVRGKLRDLDARAERNGFLVISYLRLAYVPFAPLNYAAGLTRIRFLDYFFGSIVGMLPGIFIFTALVDELTNLGSPADLLATRFLTPLTLLVASFFLPLLLKRLAPALPFAAGSRKH
jgi:uncharacterized membrane protein YdjX (TVP38/TMEM64 family)